MNEDIGVNNDIEPIQSAETRTFDSDSFKHDSPVTPQATTLVQIRRLLVYLALLCTAVALYFSKGITMPIVLGILVALTLTPLVRALQRFYVPAPLGAILVVVSISAVLTVGIRSLSEPVAEVFSQLPRVGETISAHLLPYRDTIDGLSQASDTVEKLAGGSSDEQAETVVMQGPGIVTSAASTLATGLTTLFIALVFSIFLLGTGSMFYEKLVAAMPTLTDKKRSMRIVRRIEKSVSHYLLTITLINVCLGVCVASLLYAYGHPEFVLWGVIACVMNFLPFLGALIGTALLFIVSLGVYDTLVLALIPPMIYYGCSALEGNFITPYIVGRRLRLNIVAVFLSVVFWGWLWGIGGALMAVPILILISVLCDNITSLRSIGLFISESSIDQES